MIAVSGGEKLLDRIKALVRDKEMCVMATVSGSEPYCSLMAYAVGDDCREIYMVTHRKTKKFENLSENPNVSLLIDTRDDVKGSTFSNAVALTVNGVFQEIFDGKKREQVRNALLARHSDLSEFIGHPDAELLCIRVSSFLFLNGLTEAHFVSV